MRMYSIQSMLFAVAVMVMICLTPAATGTAHSQSQNEEESAQTNDRAQRDNDRRDRRQWRERLRERRFRGMPSLRGFLRPEFSGKDLPIMRDELSLSEDQTTIAEGIIEKYESEFTIAADALRETFEESREDINFEVDRDQIRQQMRERFREMRRKLQEEQGIDFENMDRQQRREIFRKNADEIRKHFESMRPQFESIRDQFTQLMLDMAPKAERFKITKAQLRADLISNLQAQLVQKQTEQWPAFERKLTRRKQLPEGELSGESLNLFEIIRNLDLQEAVAVQEQLEAYGPRMHEALTHREQVLYSTNIDLFKAALENDAGRMKSLLNRQVQARLTVRSINDEFISAIIEALPEQTSAEFRDAARKQAYERVYRQTEVQRMIEDAKKLDSLDSETRESIKEFEQAYAAELALANEQLVRVIHSKEPERIKQRAERLATRGWGGFGRGWGRDRDGRNDDDNPIRDQFEKRRELNERYRERLVQMFTPEQFAAIAEFTDRF